MNKNTVNGLREMQWNSPLHYEPVGTRVLILLEDLTIEKAYRKAPTDDKDKTGTYYHAITNKKIRKEVHTWAYP